MGSAEVEDIRAHARDDERRAELRERCEHARQLGRLEGRAEMADRMWYAGGLVLIAVWVSREFWNALFR